LLHHKFGDACALRLERRNMGIVTEWWRAIKQRPVTAAVEDEAPFASKRCWVADGKTGSQLRAGNATWTSRRQTFRTRAISQTSIRMIAMILTYDANPDLITFSERKGWRHPESGGGRM